MLQIRYPPTIEIMVGNGPIQASVYCASPPVVFGIRPFSSESEATVVIFSRQAIIIAPINGIPTVPAPCPNDTRQLVAMTSPTETETTLPNPNFLFFSMPIPPCSLKPFPVYPTMAVPHQCLLLKHGGKQ